MPVSPPRPKGPPLNALRAFEAAARLGGFAPAANELCVTPGAVAQQVKVLESWAGARLFERRAQGVTLTPLGAGVLADFSDAFDRLGEAVQSLRSRAEPRQVRVAALPSVAQLWLSPRLPAIRQAAPDIEISVTALEVPPNLKREPFDIGIFFEHAPLGPGSISIAPDVIYPVCSPAIARRLRQPSDLKGMTLLHDGTWSDDWRRWTAATLRDERFDLTGPVFSLYSLAVEEAKNGAGVLIGHESLVAELLALGDLVAPFERRVVLDRHLTINPAGPIPAKSEIERVIDALRR